MKKKIEISFEELKNGSMAIYGKYCDLFKQSGNTIMLLAMYHRAFMIACYESGDLLKSVNGNKCLSVSVGNGKVGSLIDFEITLLNGKFVATEPLFDCGTFADGGFSFMDITKMLMMAMTYPPKLNADAVLEYAIKN